MSILQDIFEDHYEEMLYLLHPSQTIIENVDKMIHCGDPFSDGTMYGCTKCGNLKFAPFHCHRRFLSCLWEYVFHRSHEGLSGLFSCEKMPDSRVRGIQTYAAFAQQYGFLPNPCRVYTPTDKGKVESNVRYIKENCFKGRDFTGIEEAKAFLKKWLKETANARKHGTTGKIPSELFETLEALKLRKLPEKEFLFTKSAPATVWTDCHLSYGGNYYSAPYTYIGCEVEVIEVNNLIKVYYKGKEIALHVLKPSIIDK